jgi:FixJ family two-component response regulator
MRDLRSPVVRVVDDDPALLRSLSALLKAAGLRVVTYDNADAFFDDRNDAPGCAVVDLHMPETSGLQLQELMLGLDNPLPVIFLTGRGDVSSSVRAMKSGAVDFLTKPVSGEVLLEAVRTALEIDAGARVDRRHRAELAALYATLTVRERQVFGLVAQGFLNKQIAGELGTSERTVKAHRSNIMRKLQLESVAQLVRLADRLAVSASPG